MCYKVGTGFSADVPDVLLILPLISLDFLVLTQALADRCIDLLGPLHERGGVDIELEDG